MTSAVLDSSALLAVLNSEPGAEIVHPVLYDAAISAVNYAEVVTKLVERGAAPALVSKAVASLDIAIVDFDSSLAESTGALRPQTRHAGLSLADRACLALAQRERVSALTADRVWASLSLGIDITVIG
jgi:PIN domain nuclease of toxin-antitoxin system